MGFLKRLRKRKEQEKRDRELHEKIVKEEYAKARLRTLYVKKAGLEMKLEKLRQKIRARQITKFAKAKQELQLLKDELGHTETAIKAMEKD